MAVTGARVVCSTSQLVSAAGTVCGQGIYPDLWVLYSTDDVAVKVPAWSDATAKVRSFQTSRGRESPLDEVDAGTADIALDNRARTFDPVSNTAVRPLNRWWIREQFNGVTEDIFFGYAESYDQQWPDVGGLKDAVAVVHCADEFKVLAAGKLPTTNPPRDTYQDLVAFAVPYGYWPMDDSTTTVAQTGNPGPTLILQTSGMQGLIGDGGIVGQEPERCLRMQHGDYLATTDLAQGDPGDAANLSEITIEGWFRVVNTVADMNLVVGPAAGSASTYRLYMASGAFAFDARNSSGTNITVAGGAITVGVWYHVAGVVQGSNVFLYVNSTLVDEDTWSGTFAAAMDAGASLIVGPNTGSGTEQVDIDELAFYRTGIPAATLISHYQAGAQRGFARGQTADVRAGAVLDAVSNHAPRDLRAGTRAMTGSYMTGQPPLDELRRARAAENVDAMLYVSRSGAVTLLDAAHRTQSPWTTSQGTFGDGAGESPYLSLETDYSDSFLANTWNVTTSAGTTRSATDSASVTAYWERPQSITDLPVAIDSAAGTVAVALLAKYKDPMYRITSITPKTSDPDVAGTVFARDLGDRITIVRRPPGGGTITQTSYVQKIEISGDRSEPFLRCRWGVSPL